APPRPRSKVFHAPTTARGGWYRPEAGMQRLAYHPVTEACRMLRDENFPLSSRREVPATASHAARRRLATRSPPWQPYDVSASTPTAGASGNAYRGLRKPRRTTRKGSAVHFSRRTEGFGRRESARLTECPHQ